MEKSLLSFATQYPQWEPEAAAKQLLTTLSLHQHHPLHASPHFPYTAFAEQLQPAMAPGASPAADAGHGRALMQWLHGHSQLMSPGPGPWPRCAPSRKPYLLVQLSQ